MNGGVLVVVFSYISYWLLSRMKVYLVDVPVEHGNMQVLKKKKINMEVEKQKQNKKKQVYSSITYTKHKESTCSTSVLKNIILRQDIKKHMQKKIRLTVSRRQPIASQEVEVVLLLGGQDIPADGQHWRIKG